VHCGLECTDGAQLDLADLHSLREVISEHHGRDSWIDAICIYSSKCRPGHVLCSMHAAQDAVQLLSAKNQELHALRARLRHAECADVSARRPAHRSSATRSEACSPGGVPHCTSAHSSASSAATRWKAPSALGGESTEELVQDNRRLKAEVDHVYMLLAVRAARHAAAL
jgi:hypothetical protein